MSKLVSIRLIGIIFLVVILLSVDLKEVWLSLYQVGSSSLLAAVCCFYILLSMRCIRWVLLSNSFTGDTKLLPTLLSCNRSIWLGLITPGRVGELTRAADLASRSDVRISTASGLVLFDLVLDLLVFCVLAGAGLAAIFVVTQNIISDAYILFLLTGFVTLASIRWPLQAALEIAPWLLRIPGCDDLLPNLVRRFRSWLSAGVVGLTFGAALAYAFMMASLLPPSTIELDPIALITMVGLVGVVGAIPLTYFGFGTRELTLIWYLGLFGYAAETAVAVSFFFVLAQLLSAVASLLVDLVGRFLMSEGYFGAS